MRYYWLILLLCLVGCDKVEERASYENMSDVRKFMQRCHKELKGIVVLNRNKETGLVDMKCEYKR